MNTKQTILHLSLIDGIGPVTIQKLLAKLPATSAVGNLYQMATRDLMQLGLSAKMAQNIIAGLRDTTALAKELQLIEKHNISWTVLGAADYPCLLAEIYSPPPVLYYKGMPVFHEPQTIAVVGARRAHRYGQQAIDQMVPGLVANGRAIVRGGAFGADSMAHRAAVRADGTTVVVLGSGLLRLYPVSHKNLFDSIVEHGGVLVSSFPLMTQAQPGNFPARNRIIAGLSRGCVVVQAAAKSGARITAQFALEQGREVFAIPGPIDDELSAGCHGLIQEGAKLISCAHDIMVEFEPGLRRSRPSVPLATPNRSDLSEAPQASRLTKNLSPQEKIMHACARPSSVDELATVVQIDIAQLQELLFDLQLAGQLKQNFAGLWER